MSDLAWIGLFLLVWYMLDCLYDPWTDCVWCKGSAKRRGSDSGSSTFHFCAVPRWLLGCGGRGRRRRLGSLLLRIGLGKLD